MGESLGTLANVPVIPEQTLISNRFSISKISLFSIAGSDPSGGAGLQADLNTFHQYGVYGTSLVTLLTVPNTPSVSEVRFLDPEFVLAQLDAVGMLIAIRSASVRLRRFDAGNLARSRTPCTSRRRPSIEETYPSTRQRARVHHEGFDARISRKISFDVLCRFLFGNNPQPATPSPHALR